MNPNTNELRTFKDIIDLEKAHDEGFLPVPGELKYAASCTLKGRESVMISKTSGGKLSKWAANKRRQRAK